MQINRLCRRRIQIYLSTELSWDVLGIVVYKVFDETLGYDGKKCGLFKTRKVIKDMDSFIPNQTKIVFEPFPLKSEKSIEVGI